MIGEEFAHVLHDVRLPVDIEHWTHRLRHDPIFAMEMKVCREWQIPHTEFLGWSEVDREKAIAYVVHEGQRCSECGTHPSVWPNEDDEPLKVVGHRCFACVAVNEFIDNYQERSKDRHGEPMKGAMWGLRTKLVPTDPWIAGD